MDDKNCRNCWYWKKMHHERCCHYILIEGKKRPCEPGSKCTVKIPIKEGYGRAKRAVQD